MNLIDAAESGFTYTVEVVKDGRVIDREVVHNLMPEEGRNHMLDVTLGGGTQITTWYLLPFSGDYTPVSGDTAATFPASATEATQYTDATRKALVFGAAAGGVKDNSANRAELEFNDTVTVYGAAIVSAAAKGAASGVLISAARFATAKPMENGAILRITAGITLSSS